MNQQGHFFINDVVMTSFNPLITIDAKWRHAV